MLTKAGLCAVKLMCSPDIENDCFVQCERQYRITLKPQIGNDLGQRMLSAVAAELKGYKYCIVIGTDAPALDEVMIKHAIESLRIDENNVVFVPAEDGGYVLLGLQQAYEFLFKDIDWGSAQVMEQSRNQLKINKIRCSELGTCWDVDRLEDYKRYLAM